MGITITATKSKHDFDMGYGGFFNLRKNIAIALDEDFGQTYAGLAKCFSDKEYEDRIRLAESIINRKRLDEEYADVLDFLFASDVEGKIGYKTCKKILGLLEKNMETLKDKSFRYGAYANHDYEDFIEFLKDCVKSHKNMRWW